MLYVVAVKWGEWTYVPFTVNVSSTVMQNLADGAHFVAAGGAETQSGESEVHCTQSIPADREIIIIVYSSLITHTYADNFIRSQRTLTYFFLNMYGSQN